MSKSIKYPHLSTAMFRDWLTKNLGHHPKHLVNLNAEKRFRHRDGVLFRLRRYNAKERSSIKK